MSRFRWLRTAGRGFAVAALAVLLIGGFVTDGRIRAAALALVAVWLLLGLVVVTSATHAMRAVSHTTSRLPPSSLWGASAGASRGRGQPGDCRYLFPPASASACGWWPPGPGANWHTVVRLTVSLTASVDQADDDVSYDRRRRGRHPTPVFLRIASIRHGGAIVRALRYVPSGLDEPGIRCDRRRGPRRRRARVLRRAHSIQSDCRRRDVRGLEYHRSSDSRLRTRPALAMSAGRSSTTV